MTVRTSSRQQVSVSRGVALMLALVALVITSGVTVALARLAVIDRTTRRLNDAQRLADDLLLACEAPITHWLENESAEVVLPADAQVPAAPILYDRWLDGEQEFEIFLTAFDQTGMAAPNHLQSGSLMRLAIPSEVLSFVDAWPGDNEPATGLDEYRLDETTRLSVYPELTGDGPIWFGASQTLFHYRTESAQPANPSLGAWLAAHNPPPGRINVHTAPMPLIEQALREAGRGGYELILAARESGEPVSLGDIASVRDPTERAPRLVGSSSTWAVRIDIQAGTLRRSWWSVYQNVGGWECVQRHVIIE